MGDGWRSRRASSPGSHFVHGIAADAPMVAKRISSHK